MTPAFPYRSLASALILGLAILASAAGTANATGASDVVHRFHERLMPVLGTNSTVPAPQRVAPIRNAVGDAFHMPLIGRLVVGTSWNGLDRTTKQRLTSAILTLNVATYLNRLGEQRLRGHRIDDVRAGENDTYLVDATIDTTSGPMHLTYATRQLKGRWWIFDVLLDSRFSELDVRRNEYRGLIAERGVPGLIDALERQTAELAFQPN